MSQPPQNGWGRSPSGDTYGQSSPNGGYGQQGFGQGQPGYGQGQAGYPQPGYGQASPNGGYGQDASFAPSFGDAGGQGAYPQGGAPKKSNKLPIILCAGCAVLILLLVLVGGGLFLLARTGTGAAGGGDATASATVEDPTDEATDAPTDGTTDEPTEAPSEESSEAPSETPSEAPAGGGDGTESSPYAIGETFTIGDGDDGTYDITIGEINWDATDEVMAVSDTNTAPGDGMTYILVPMTLTYHGSGTASPGFAVIMEYVSSAGTTYGDEYALVPNDWLYIGDLADGESGSWETAMIVPTDEVQDGRITVRALLDFTADPTYVAVS